MRPPWMAEVAVLQEQKPAYFTPGLLPFALWAIVVPPMC